MRAEEFVQILRRRPFVPFRVHMTDGQTYDIRHPELVIVLRQRVDIGVGPDPATGVVERVDFCSLLHIVRVEDLPPGAPSDGTAAQTGTG